SALGVPAILGRTITESDDDPGEAPVIVISHRYWSTRFGSDQSIVGKQVNINNVAFTIGGVTPPGFEGPMQVGSTLDIAMPIAWEPQISGERSMSKGAGIWWIRMMARLR